MDYGILARATPSSTLATPITEGLLALTSESAVISSLVVTNTTPYDIEYSVYFVLGGSTTASIDNALIYKQVVRNNDTVALTYGLALGWWNGSNSDVLYVESSIPNGLTFTVFGSKVEN
jgi:hypothetical protein